jgi:hypothetical protein
MIRQHANDTAEILLEKIRELPQDRVLEIIDFVDFLRSRSQNEPEDLSASGGLRALTIQKPEF